MSVLFNILFLFGMVTVIFLSPAVMSVGLVRVSNKDYSIEKQDYVFCSIPVFNQIYSCRKYTGSSISLSAIGAILFYVSFIVRTISMMFFYGNENLQLYTVIAFLICFVLYWVLTSVDIFRILGDSGIYTTSNKVMSSIVFPIGQIQVGYYMPRKMHYYYSKNTKGDLYDRG